MEKNTKIYILFLISNLLLNYDTGVIPASLLEIQKEINFDYTEQALLGSLVYLGLSTASLFVSPIISKYGAKDVCSIVLLLNSLCCFIFSLSKDKFILFSNRFLMGITESFVVIYGPVWINNYSPQNKSTTWLGILHATTIFGMITGYIFSGIVINFMSNFFNWRFAIQIQGIFLIPVSILFYFEDDNYISIKFSSLEEEYEANINRYNSQKDFFHKINFTVESKNSRNIKSDILNSERAIYIQKKIYSSNENILKEGEIGEEKKSKSQKKEKNSQKSYSHYSSSTKNIYINFLKKSIKILSNPIYISMTFGLCSVYFIVTNIQFWMTAYLIDIIGANPLLVVSVFSFSSITAPLLGILIGGTLSDNYGGYKGKNTYKAIQMCVAFGLIAFIFAFPLGFIFSFIYITILLWAFLFFGAAIVPICTGIMISSIKQEDQATSNSLSQLIFNLGGYFLSPFLTGFIMDCFDDEKQGFIWGMRVGFWWVFFSVFSLIFAWVYEYKKRNKYKIEGLNQDSSSSAEEEMEANFADFIKLEIRRRIALSKR